MGIPTIIPRCELGRFSRGRSHIGMASVLSELSSAFDESESPEQVEVNDLETLLSNEQLATLKERLNPFDYSVEESEQVYVALRQYIKECVMDT